MPIRVELELDNGQFTSRMIHAGETVQQFRNNVNGTIRSIERLNDTQTTLLGTIRDVSIAFGMFRIALDGVRNVATGWIGDIVKINAEMEKLQFLLKGLSTAADPAKDAADSFKFLRDAAKDAPFSLGALTDTFVKMKATGIDPVKGSFKGLLDAISAFGGTDEALKRATVAITQMSGKGVIQMEELRQQLGEAVPRAVELMARSMGISTGQLITTIGKGTLDAKSSLQALSLEFELTFGGAAQAQMKTFNGMISQSTTLMQNLALKMGDGFFEIIKSQLRDINAALAGDVMGNVATKAGAMLGSVVNSISNGIRWVVEFKNELLNLGIAIGSAFAVATIIKAGSAIAASFANMRAEAALTAVQFRMAREQIGAVAGLVPAVNSLGSAMSLTAMSGGALKASMSALGAGLMFIGSSVVPIVGLIAVLAFQFGLLADKEKDAFESLQSFGATSEKQLKDAEAYIARQRAIIDGLKEMKAAQQDYASAGMSETAAAFGVDTDGDLGKMEVEQRDRQKKLADETIAFRKRQTEALARVALEEIDDRQFSQRAAYDKEAKAREEAYGKELDQLRISKGDNKAATLKHQQENRAAQLEFLELQYQDLQAALDKQAMLVAENNENALKINDKYTAEVISRQLKNREQANSLKNMPLGPQENSKLDDIDKLIDRAKKKTEELQASNAGLRAELAGASNEYAKLAFMINEARAKGNFAGPLDNEQIKAATDALLQQQAIFDEYTRRVNAQRAQDAELNRILLKARQDLSAAQNQSKNDVDKFVIAMREGAYSGLTPIQQLNEKFKEISGTAKGAGDAMKEAFDGVLPAVTGLNQRLDQARTGMRSFGASQASRGGSIDERIAFSEAGGNRFATNPNSSATGLGQFIESTWLQFLKEMHPEIARGMGNGELKDATREAALALRTNAQLSMEAISWYREKNTAQLNGAGFAASDANLKLAHFLGGGGAVSALGKSDDTLVRSIPELTAAIKANYDVFKKIATVGDLKAWADRSVGGSKFKPIYDNDPRQDYSNLPFATQRILDEAALTIQKANGEKAINAVSDWLKEIAAKANAAREDDGGKLSNYAAGRKKIQAGEGPFGKAFTNPDDERYTAILEALKKLDAAEEESSQRKKTRTAFETALQKQGIEDVSLAQRQAEMEHRYQEEQKFKFSAGYYAKLKELQKDTLLATTAVNTGAKTQAEADAFLGKQKEQLEAQRVLELKEAEIREQEKQKVVQRGLLSESQARDAALNEEIRRIENIVAQYQIGTQERVDAEARANRQISALRQQAFNSTPLGKMLKDYRDFSANMEKATVGWIDSFSDGLAKMVMKGKFDFKSLADSIITDIIRIGIRASIANLAGGLFGFGGGGGGGIVLGGAGGPGQFATHHSGGIVGQNSASRMADLSIFSGAPKFHTGSRGLTLGGDEIPIIAKRGEQIDWPENLAKQYGGGAGMTIAPSIAVSVQGNPGASEADHQKLGERIGKAVEERVRVVMAQELRTQMKPGGMLRK